jgi:TonB family protein
MCVLFATSFGFAQTAPVPPKPLGRIELLALRIDGVSDARLEKLLQQRGVAFQPDERYHRMLQDAGATSDLMSALDTAKIAPDAGGTGSGSSSGGQDSAAREALVLEHMDRGAQLDRNRFHPREAEPEYRAAVDADPTSGFAHLVLGDILERLGQRDPAIDEFREAVRLQPDMAEAHFALANALDLKKGDRQEAFAEFDRALTLAPDDSRIRSSYAHSLEAVREFDRALTVAPDDASVRSFYAHSLETDGKKAEAEEQLRIAKNLSSASPTLGVPLRIRVGGQVMRAKLIFKPNPKYPREAKKNRIQGTVKVEALIGDDGSVIDLEVLSGDPALVKAATDAVLQWRYQPTLLNGRPIQVVTEIDINFTLAE